MLIFLHTFAQNCINMDKKHILLIIGSIVSILLIGSISYLSYQNKELKDKLSIAESNIKSYDIENTNLKISNREFKLTIDQLNYFNDSILQEINKVRKELKIKDRDLKQVQYLLSEAKKKDTVNFRDTIFRDKNLQLDTLLGDKWYQLKLGLKYPNIIITEPKFTSEKYIICNYKVETIEPPKKCFILRWFQRKHKVVEVNIMEKNPYIINKQQKFIEIIE